MMEGVNDSQYHTLRYKAEFFTSGGTIVRSTSLTSPDEQIGYQVVINGGGMGSTFKLTELPTEDPHEVGVLFASNYDDTVRISKG